MAKKSLPTPEIAYLSKDEFVHYMQARETLSPYEANVYLRDVSVKNGGNFTEMPRTGYKRVEVRVLEGDKWYMRLFKKKFSSRHCIMRVYP